MKGRVLLIMGERFRKEDEVGVDLYYLHSLTKKRKEGNFFENMDNYRNRLKGRKRD